MHSLSERQGIGVGLMGEGLDMPCCSIMAACDEEDMATTRVMVMHRVYGV